MEEMLKRQLGLDKHNGVWLTKSDHYKLTMKMLKERKRKNCK